MMTQAAAPRDELPNLFSRRPLLSTTHIAQDAASKLAPKRHRQIIELLSTRGPLAAWQMAEALGLPMHSISGRITELRKAKIIEETGERRTNPRSGVAGEVLRLSLSHID